MELRAEPEAVLGIRPGVGENLRGIDVLIQWKGLPPLEATWEPYDAINQQFPFFHLEDKVNLEGRGIDRPQITATYRKRTREARGSKGTTRREEEGSHGTT
ncbi:Chromo domain-containing protein [Abeliophyllum distichum]|uniref:Chromo domain-containing protein n=1 Tax=Abeliophyllum distichum TaxID=126358 RepID=A0ABD1SZQ0_9LAMI